MTRYDPQRAPSPKRWLALDEDERVDLVEQYHRKQRIRLPNRRLHAMMHVVVENQLALGETVVVETLARLQREGLDRHDALHAIASVLVEGMYALLHEERPRDEPLERYREGLRKLTASDWREG